jgi:ABC-2 type transport system permease protein
MIAREQTGARYAPGQRRFGRVNWLGMWTLCHREIWRFAKVWAQTLLAPVATAGLFMAVFHFALASRRGDVMGVPFEHFLAPGVLMMTVIQNAFANTSSSLVISKVQGNIVDTLMPPLSALELLVGYSAGGLARGLAVGAAVAVPAVALLGVGVAHPLWALAFLVLGALMLGFAGIAAGVICEKFDQMAAVTNFVVTPLAFLSGTFYTLDDLPPGFAAVTEANPVYHLIDGFRFGVLGGPEAPWAGLAYVAAAATALGLLCWRLFHRGIGLKS